MTDFKEEEVLKYIERLEELKLILTQFQGTKKLWTILNDLSHNFSKRTELVMKKPKFQKKKTNADDSDSQIRNHQRRRNLSTRLLRRTRRNNKNRNLSSGTRFDDTHETKFYGSTIMKLQNSRVGSRLKDLSGHLYIPQRGLNYSGADKSNLNQSEMESQDNNYDINRKYLQYKKKMMMFQNEEDKKNGLNFIPTKTKLNFSQFKSSEKGLSLDMKHLQKTYGKKSEFLKQHDKIVRKVTQTHLDDQLKNPRSPFSMRDNTIDFSGGKEKRITPKRKVQSHRRENDLSLVTSPIENRIQYESGMKLNKFGNPNIQEGDVIKETKNGIKFVKKSHKKRHDFIQKFIDMNGDSGTQKRFPRKKKHSSAAHLRRRHNISDFKQSVRLKPKSQRLKNSISGRFSQKQYMSNSILQDTTKPIDILELRKFIRKSRYIHRKGNSIPFSSPNKSLNMKTHTFDWNNIKYGIQRREQLGLYYWKPQIEDADFFSKRPQSSGEEDSESSQMNQKRKNIKKILKNRLQFAEELRQKKKEQQELRREQLRTERQNRRLERHNKFVSFYNKVKELEEQKQQLGEYEGDRKPSGESENDNRFNANSTVSIEDQKSLENRMKSMFQYERSSTPKMEGYEVALDKQNYFSISPIPISMKKIISQNNDGDSSLKRSNRKSSKKSKSTLKFLHRSHSMSNNSQELEEENNNSSSVKSLEIEERRVKEFPRKSLTENNSSDIEQRRQINDEKYLSSKEKSSSRGPQSRNITQQKQTNNKNIINHKKAVSFFVQNNNFDDSIINSNSPILKKSNTGNIEIDDNPEFDVSKLHPTIARLRGSFNFEPKKSNFKGNKRPSIVSKNTSNRKKRASIQASLGSNRKKSNAVTLQRYQTPSPELQDSRSFLSNTKCKTQASKKTKNAIDKFRRPHQMKSAKSRKESYNSVKVDKYESKPVRRISKFFKSKGDLNSKNVAKNFRQKRATYKRKNILKSSAKLNTSKDQSFYGASGNKAEFSFHKYEPPSQNLGVPRQNFISNNGNKLRQNKHNTDRKARIYLTQSGSKNNLTIPKELRRHSMMVSHSPEQLRRWEKDGYTTSKNDRFKKSGKQLGGQHNITFRNNGDNLDVSYARSHHVGSESKSGIKRDSVFESLRSLSEELSEDDQNQKTPDLNILEELSAEKEDSTKELQKISKVKSGVHALEFALNQLHLTRKRFILYSLYNNAIPQSFLMPQIRRFLIDFEIKSQYWTNMTKNKRKSSESKIRKPTNKIWDPRKQFRNSVKKVQDVLHIMDKISNSGKHLETKPKRKVSKSKFINFDSKESLNINQDFEDENESDSNAISKYDKIPDFVKNEFNRQVQTVEFSVITPQQSETKVSFHTNIINDLKTRFNFFIILNYKVEDFKGQILKINSKLTSQTKNLQRQKIKSWDIMKAALEHRLEYQRAQYLTKFKARSKELYGSKIQDTSRQIQIQEFQNFGLKDHENEHTLEQIVDGTKLRYVSQEKAQKPGASPHEENKSTSNGFLAYTQRNAFRRRRKKFGRSDIDDNPLISFSPRNSSRSPHRKSTPFLRNRKSRFTQSISRVAESQLKAFLKAEDKKILMTFEDFQESTDKIYDQYFKIFGIEGTIATVDEMNNIQKVVQMLRFLLCQHYIVLKSQIGYKFQPINTELQDLLILKNFLLTKFISLKRLNFKKLVDYKSKKRRKYKFSYENNVDPNLSVYSELENTENPLPMIQVIPPSDKFNEARSRKVTIWKKEIAFHDEFEGWNRLNYLEILNKSPHRLKFVNQVVKTKVFKYQTNYWMWFIKVNAIPIEKMLNRNDRSNMLESFEIELHIYNKKMTRVQKSAYTFKKFMDQLNLSLRKRKDFVKYFSSNFYGGVTYKKYETEFSFRIELQVKLYIEQLKMSKIPRHRSRNRGMSKDAVSHWNHYHNPFRNDNFKHEPEYPFVEKRVVSKIVEIFPEISSKRPVRGFSKFKEANINNNAFNSMMAKYSDDPMKLVLKSLADSNLELESYFRRWSKPVFKKLTHGKINFDRSVYLAQTLNFAYLGLKDNITFYLSDRNPFKETLNYKISLRKQSYFTKRGTKKYRPVVDIWVYDFSKQLLDFYQFKELGIVERFYPIMIDPDSENYSYRCLILFKILLITKDPTDFSMKKLIFHNRSIKPYKIDYYDKSAKSILKCLSLSIPNAYIELLKVTQISFSTYLKNFGYFFIECSVLHNMEHHSTHKHMFFKFRMFPKNRRHKFYSLVLSDLDVNALIACDPKKFYNSKHMLVQSLNKVISLFELTNTNLYKKMAINLEKIKSLPCYESNVLHNPINKKAENLATIIKYPYPESLKSNIQLNMTNRPQMNSLFYKENPEFARNLESLFLKVETKVITSFCKFVTKIENMYAISSFHFSKTMQNLFLKIYFPSTKRVLISLFSRAEMQKCDEFISLVVERVVQSIRSSKKKKLMAELARKNSRTKAKYEGQFANYKANLDNVIDCDDVSLDETSNRKSSRHSSVQKEMNKLVNLGKTVPEKLKIRGSFFKRNEAFNFGEKHEVLTSDYTSNNGESPIRINIRTLSSPKKPERSNFEMFQSSVRSKLQQRARQQRLHLHEKSKQQNKSQDSDFVGSLESSSDNIHRQNNPSNNYKTPRVPENNKKNIILAVRNKSAQGKNPIQNESLSKKKSSSSEEKNPKKTRFSVPNHMKSIQFYTKKYSEYVKRSLEYFDQFYDFGQANFNDLLQVSIRSIERDFPSDKKQTVSQKRELQRRKAVVTNHHQMLFWQYMLTTITIETKTRQKKTLKMGQFNSILREEVFSRECILDGEIYLIEILLENDQMGNFKMEPFGNFKLDNLQGLFFFLKLRNFSENTEINDKISLSLAIEAIKEKQKLKGITIYDIDKLISEKKFINISVIRQIAKIIAFQIFDGLQNDNFTVYNKKKNLLPEKSSRNSVGAYRTHRGSISDQKVTVFSRFGKSKSQVVYLQRNSNLHLTQNLKSLISLKHSMFMNFHSRLCTKLGIKETDNFILLYKSKLVQTPASLCWVLFDMAHRQFMFLVYCQYDQSTYKFSIENNNVNSQVPFAFIGMQNKDYLNVGKRIFLSFKNTILIKFAKIVSEEKCSSIMQRLGREQIHFNSYQQIKETSKHLMNQELDFGQSLIQSIKKSKFMQNQPQTNLKRLRNQKL